MLRDIIEELKQKVNRVAALTAAMVAMSSGGSAGRVQIERVRALAEVAEECADESAAMVERCLSHIDRQ